jgi:threonyl-tRNA synthetase
VAGAFPTWLAPVQATFLPINDECAEACHAAADELRSLGLRVEVDDRSEKLGYKIREAELAKTPYMLVVGMKEKESGKFSVRTYQEGDRGQLSFQELRDELVRKTRERTFDVNLKTFEWSSEEEEEISDAMNEQGY